MPRFYAGSGIATQRPVNPRAACGASVLNGWLGGFSFVDPTSLSAEASLETPSVEVGCEVLVVPHEVNTVPRNVRFASTETK